MGQEDPTGPEEGPRRTDVQAPLNQKNKKRFYGKVNLNTTTAKIQFSEIFDEVLSHFVQKHDTNVVISVEVESTSIGGFDENFQRIVKENGGQLKFVITEFEEE